jgi:mycothiol system anti-sigma-R factor
MAEGDDNHSVGHCDDVLESMYLYLDNEMLSDAERAQIRTHLNECMPCVESFEFEAEFKEIVRTKCTDDVPMHVSEKIRARLTVEMESRAQQSEG